MGCPDAIKRLVDHFDHQSDQVRSLEYNETLLRGDFVNPMFSELGWDIYNSQRFAEQYREVVHEDHVKVAGATKAPDYSFRIGGVRKFFLEAKKPFVKLKHNVDPAYQLRRYGWSAKLAISLLTNFEELAVYDCRIRPKQLDKASTARREYITYKQYEDKWDFLSGTYSREAVLRGDFDRYCGTTRGRGAQEFDEAFLAEIEEWRKKLASNLALRNEALDERSLNFAVQRIIDRIIFLRICEDRGIERVGRLQSLLNGENVYRRLVTFFESADDRYNSGLFHFKPETGREESPDTLTPKLEVDDATLKSTIRRLYYPESPYEFTVVSADILGSVYERFLGKIITLTDGHRAKLEEKPEVRKAGGVYYTPTYIVDYIVQHTVGKLLEGRTPKEAGKITILDPACGSGSFLIGAYQYLLDWHLKWYTEHEPQSWSRGKNAPLRPGRDGEWRLTINQRKRILLDNIHGVDIDYQAVEVTKLSLLLKVLEGETAESLGGLWALSHERALPDLGNNIKCGNSLIGTDIFETEWGRSLSTQGRADINPFDWHREFPALSADEAFDVIVGNPPYLNAIEERTRFADITNRYLREKFTAARGAVDSSILFQDLALQLLRQGGRTSMIVPNKFLSAPFGEAYRKLAADCAELRLLADFSAAKVFGGVGVYPVVYVLEKVARPRPQYDTVLEIYAATNTDPALARNDTVSAGLTGVHTWSQLFSQGGPLLERLRADYPRLEETFEIAASATAAEAYLLKKCLTDEKPPGESFLFVTSGAIDRYHHAHGSLPMRYLKSEYQHPYLPAGCTHLTDKRRRQYSSEKLILAGMTRRLEAIWDDGHLAGSVPTVQILRTNRSGQSLKFVLGVVNSHLANWVFNQYFSSLGLAGGYLRIGVPQVGQLPLPKLDMRDDVHCRQHDKVVDTVEGMMSLHERWERATTPYEKTMLQRQIDAQDEQIDRLVYSLFGLAEDEIALLNAHPGVKPSGVSVVHAHS